MIVSLIFFTLASICNAVMDTCSFHFSTSIFSKLNPKFWDSTISWLQKYNNSDPSKGMRKIFFGLFNYPVFLTDSFHLFKSLSITFICISIATFDGYIIYHFCTKWLNVVISIMVFGTFWNLFFNLFYNFLLRRKIKP